MNSRKYDWAQHWLNTGHDMDPSDRSAERYSERYFVPYRVNVMACFTAEFQYQNFQRSLADHSRVSKHPSHTCAEHLCHLADDNV